MAETTRSSRKRFRTIVRALAAYGFGHVINTRLRTGKREKDPENLRLVFEELGPTFVKIGQILSTRPDILPKAYIYELQKLQDNVPAFPYATMLRILTEELQGDPFRHFASIDAVPMACASVAQVHGAVLRDGTPVILKVQRPDIEARLLEDMDILIRIVRKAPNTFRDVMLDPLEALEEIRDTTHLELDFQNELRYMERFRTENRHVACLRVPATMAALTSKRLLVLERVEGIKIRERDLLTAKGYDPRDIGRKLVLSYLHQIFANGFFHGDPHPGNLLIKDRHIYYIDFGIMGVLSNPARQAFNAILRALVQKDIASLVDQVLRVGIQKGHVDRNRLHEDIENIVHTYFHASLSSVRISILFMDLLEAARENRLKLPKEYTILLKSLLILEGVLAELSPDENIMDIARSYLKEDQHLPGLPKPDLEILALDGAHFLRDSLKIPTRLNTILDNYISGRGKVRVDIVNLSDHWVDFNKMVNRVVFALIVAAIIIASALIIRAGGGPEIQGLSLIGVLGFGLAFFFGIWLLVSILKSGNI